MSYPSSLLWEADDMERLRSFLKDRAAGDLLPLAVQRKAAEEFGLSLHQVEEIALESGLLPIRYERNRKTITTEQQLHLFRSKVAVIGCGGLGGYVIAELARLGIGTIKAVDPDVFEEHNLNRQLFCDTTVLGLGKAEVAAAAVGKINPAVSVIPLREAFSETNARDHLADAQVVVDALDSIPVRIALAEACDALGIPLVHGSIGGWYGQVTSQFPGEKSVQKIYGHTHRAEGIEKILGNPSFTPGVVASLQVAEVCKILLGEGTLLSGRVLFINLLDMEMELVTLP
jgi:molybdopterin/thiamine biosynthesis adenylyltransferase